MLLPVRCACTKVIGNKGNRYKTLIHEFMRKGIPESLAIENALNELGLKRICCRIELLTHVNLHDKAIDQNKIEQEEIANRPINTIGYFDDGYSEEEQDED